MTTRRGSSIRMFLVDGEPDGLRIVEKSNWSGVVLVAPRSAQAELRRRSELDGPGTYLLVGPGESADQLTIYVGEADDVGRRIAQHVAKGDDFWNTAVVLTSKDSYLNKAHVRWLEWKLIELARAVGSAVLVNGNGGATVRLSESDEAEVEAYLDEALVLLPLLGVRAFHRRRRPAEPERIRLHLSGTGGAAGSGFESPDGFVVEAGATARIATTAGMAESTVRKREALIESGVFLRGDEALTLTRDHAFNSASEAAGMLLGRNANGRTEWLTADGRTLKAIQQQAIEVELGAEVAGGVAD